VIIPVVLCGGAGSRLWPMSRPDEPKPFLPLIEGRSTFSLTLERLAGNPLFGPVVVIANASHRPRLERALAEANTHAAILIEPEPRDTAAAIAAAAAFVAGADAFASLLVLPADHLIRDTTGFTATVAAAAPVADAGRIVLFGIAPDRPATTFGYIKPGEALSTRTAMSVEGFIEKPDAQKAAQLVAGGWLWNGGIFLLRAATATSEIGRHAPAVAAAARTAVAQGSGDGNALVLERDAFLSSPTISFDRAVMEKTDLGAVVAARFDWSDLGTWEAVFLAAEKDADDNVIAGDAMVVDTRGSYVTTARPRIGVFGLENVVVVASDDSVLVTTRDRAPAVRELAAAVAAAPERALGDFVRHYRPWGHYQTLALGARHQVKRIVVDPGHRLSLQVHSQRGEHWTMVEGSGEVTVGPDVKNLKTRTLAPGQSIDIPRGAVHRLANRGTEPLTLIEVQNGDYLGEDDIVRIEDDYGRTVPPPR
jgi:mannose-1-phosphate guanylyltransferase/mannose-6-phosphate isomerase